MYLRFGSTPAPISIANLFHENVLPKRKQQKVDKMYGKNGNSERGFWWFCDGNGVDWKSKGKPKSIYREAGRRFLL